MLTTRSRRHKGHEDCDFFVPFVFLSLCGDAVLYLAASATTGALRLSRSLPALTASSALGALLCEAGQSRSRLRQVGFGDDDMRQVIFPAVLLISSPGANGVASRPRTS